MAPTSFTFEADVHATADNVYGYPDGAWVPYLTIGYAIEKAGSDWRSVGTLRPMTAKDGPHYAENVKMAGPGEYKPTYRIESPEKQASCGMSTRRPACPNGGSRSARSSPSSTRSSERENWSD